MMAMRSQQFKAAAVFLALGFLSSASSFGLVSPVYKTRNAEPGSVLQHHVSSSISSSCSSTALPAGRRRKESSPGVLRMAGSEDGKDEEKAKREVIGRQCPPLPLCYMHVCPPSDV